MDGDIDEQVWTFVEGEGSEAQEEEMKPSSESAVVIVGVSLGVAGIIFGSWLVSEYATEDDVVSLVAGYLALLAFAVGFAEFYKAIARSKEGRRKEK